MCWLKFIIQHIMLNNCIVLYCNKRTLNIECRLKRRNVEILRGSSGDKIGGLNFQNRIPNTKILPLHKQNTAYFMRYEETFCIMYT